MYRFGIFKNKQGEDGNGNPEKLLAGNGGDIEKLLEGNEKEGGGVGDGDIDMDKDHVDVEEALDEEEEPQEAPKFLFLSQLLLPAEQKEDDAKNGNVGKCGHAIGCKKEFCSDCCQKVECRPLPTESKYWCMKHGQRKVTCSVCPGARYCAHPENKSKDKYRCLECDGRLLCKTHNLAKVTKKHCPRCIDAIQEKRVKLSQDLEGEKKKLKKAGEKIWKLRAENAELRKRLGLGARQDEGEGDDVDKMEDEVDEMEIDAPGV